MTHVKTALALALATTGFAGLSASADAMESILYRVDQVNGPIDYLGEAVNSGLYSVTSTSGNLSGFTLSNFNIVVYANQFLSAPSDLADIAQLNAYIASGGRVIYDNWFPSEENLFNGDQNYTGETNQTSLTLTEFSSGIVSPLAVTNAIPPYLSFSQSMTALPGGTVAGTFGDGSDAIIVGNGGRTIVNGFLSDVVASEQLYANELASFTSGTVPEPSTCIMMIAGFAGLGLAGVRAPRRGKTAAL
jgi:hypothetical protein